MTRRLLTDLLPKVGRRGSDPVPEKLNATRHLAKRRQGWARDFAAGKGAIWRQKPPDGTIQQDI